MRSAITVTTAVVACAIAAHAALAGTRAEWRVVEASGAVTLTSDDTRCIAVNLHRDLPPGVVVDTGAGGRITLMRGAESIVVSPESRLTLLPEQGLETRVAQSAGMAWFKIAKKNAPHFSVQAPELTATVKGTTFTVAIDAAGVAVHVREGAVEVATGWRDAVTLVKAGTMARVQRAAPDRIALMNGGNVLRTVTGYDRGTTSAGRCAWAGLRPAGPARCSPRHSRTHARPRPARPSDRRRPTQLFPNGRMRRSNLPSTLAGWRIDRRVVRMVRRRGPVIARRRLVLSNVRPRRQPARRCPMGGPQAVRPSARRLFRPPPLRGTTDTCLRRGAAPAVCCLIFRSGRRRLGPSFS